MHSPPWQGWILILMACFLFGGNCVQERYLRYEHPGEIFLNVAGAIEEDMTYVMTVTYVQKLQGSGCEDYDQATGICRVRPQTFTYSPRITERSHRAHIPLKELSPGTDSGWEPYDISICVGPRDGRKQPHQCQRLYLLTKTGQMTRLQIDLECSEDWWCKPKGSKTRVAEIGELNREYIVNLSKVLRR